MSYDIDDPQESLMYGLAGLFLAGLLAMGTMWLEGSINWWIVAAASAAGFLLCGFLRDRALGWLFELLWWW